MSASAFGTLAPAVAYHAGGRPGAAEAVDVDGDHHVDLIIGDYEEQGALAVLPGHGDGTFGSPVKSPAGHWPVRLAHGDFNGDGRVDVAALDWKSARVSVLMGRSHGFAFRAPRTLALGGDKYLSDGIAAGDFNRDGFDDLVQTLPLKNAVGIALGGPAGLTSAGEYSARGETLFPTVGDFDRDGKVDVVTTDYTLDKEISFLRGRGDGTFRRAIRSESAASGPIDIVSADFTGDDILDLVVTDQTSPFNMIETLQGNGDGTFSSLGKVTLPSGYGRLGAGDLNLDGKDDLLVGTADRLSVLISQGTSFAPTQGYTLGGYGAGQPAIADFNEDGGLDVAVPTSFDNHVSVLLNQPGP